MESAIDCICRFLIFDFLLDTFDILNDKHVFFGFLGYTTPNDPEIVIGDPANLQFTQVIKTLSF